VLLGAKHRNACPVLTGRSEKISAYIQGCYSLIIVAGTDSFDRLKCMYVHCWYGSLLRRGKEVDREDLAKYMFWP
jgi:hypothetical protein